MEIRCCAFVLPSAPRSSSTHGPDGLSHHPGFFNAIRANAGKRATPSLVYERPDLVNLRVTNGTELSALYPKPDLKGAWESLERLGVTPGTTRGA